MNKSYINFLRDNPFIIIFITLVVLCNVIIFSKHLSQECFYDDFCDNLFLISYSTDYAFKYLRFPIFFSGETVGANLYLLYGHTFYSIFSMPNLLFSSEAVIKFFILAQQLYLICLIYDLLNKKIWGNTTTIFVAAILSWSIYSNTVLYSAGSLPSVIGSNFIFIGILLHIKYYLCNLNKYFYGSIITLYVGALSWPGHIINCIILFFPFVFTSYKTFTLRKIFFTALLFACSLPYLTELYNFGLTSQNYKVDLGYFKEYDNLFNRLLPIPFDINIIKKGVIDFSTPFFTTQVNVCSIFILTFLLIKTKYLKLTRELKFAIYYLFISLYYITLSVSPIFASILPEILIKTHFHYRFIHYFEISLVLSILMLSINLKDIAITSSKFNNNFIYTLIGITLTSIFIRSQYNYLSKGVYPFSNWGPTEVQGYPDNNARLKILFGPQLFTSQNKKSELLYYVPRSAAQIWSYTDITKSYSNNENIPLCIKDSLDVSSNKLEFTNELNGQCLLKTNLFPFSRHNILINNKRFDWLNARKSDDGLFTYLLINPGLNIISISLYEPKTNISIRNLTTLLPILIFYFYFFYNLFCLINGISKHKNSAIAKS